MKRLQRGAALLAAMLTVALVATFAAAALWQQWRGVEIEAAERTRVQSSWILSGALDWARLILREDAITSGAVDYLGEPWAVPLQEARLSTFLAADGSSSTTGSDSDTDADNVFLSGDIVDQQSFLNVQNLYTQTGVDPNALRSFQRLFSVLNLPQNELTRMAENFRFASDTSADNRSAAQAPLRPTRVDELVWLGLSPATVQALEPYVTILPVATQVNVNTASAEVLYAVQDGISLADAQRQVAARQNQPFRTTAAAQALVPAVTTAAKNNVSVTSSFFEVHGRLRLGDVIVEERSVVQRNGSTVTTLSRERGVLDPTAYALQQQAERR